MNNTQTAKIPMSNITRQMTLDVQVTGVKTWRVRMALGIWLLKCAALVMGCGIHVSGPEVQP